MGSEIFRGNTLVKGHDVTQEYTQSELKEYKKCKTDAIYFIENYIKIINLDEGLVNLKLYPYQKKMMKAMINNNRVALLTGRQQGKSVTMASFLLWYSLFHNNKTVGLLANKSSTAREIFSRITLMLENVPHFLQPGCRYLNKGSVEFSNQSKIITAATSSSSIRGSSLDVLALDEFAFVDNAEEFWTSTYPVVSSGKNSKVIITSTPKGLNLFHKIWSDGHNKKNDFVSLKFIWSDVPGRGKRWETKTRATVSDEQFSQEFEGNFLGSSNTLISTSSLISMTSRKVDQNLLNNTLKIYKHPEEGHTYIMTVDVSHGKGLDASAFSIIDVTSYPFEQVVTFNDCNISPLQYPSIIYHTGNMYNQAHVLVEINDIGSQIIKDLNYDLEYENIVYVDKKMGVRTTSKVKSIGCSTLRDLIESQKLIINDENTIKEFTGFVQKGMSYEADTGFHDDSVMTLVLFSWLVKSSYFDNIKTDFNLAKDLYSNELEEHESLMPLGFIVDGVNDANDVNEEFDNGFRF